MTARRPLKWMAAALAVAAASGVATFAFAVEVALAHERAYFEGGMEADPAAAVAAIERAGRLTKAFAAATVGSLVAALAFAGIAVAAAVRARRARAARGSDVT